MALRKLLRADWRPYFDHVSRRLTDEKAELEVVSLELGDRIEADWLPCYGISYDPRSDMLEIALEGIDHLIAHPRDVYVDETARGLVGVEIMTGEETHQLVKLRRPLPMPPTSPD